MPNKKLMHQRTGDLCFELNHWISHIKKKQIPAVNANGKTKHNS